MINPFIDNYNVGLVASPLRATEYDYNIDTGQFKYKDNKMYLVYDNDALKIKIWKLFMTERYKYEVFPLSYGHELETLIGREYTIGYINSEAARFVRECINRNLSEYIKRLDNLEVSFLDGVLYISFIAITIYGTLEINNFKMRW